MKKKEKEVEDRKDKIQESKGQAEKKESDYEELKKKHDAEIKQAGEKQANDDFDNPDDAADFVDDVISGIRRDD